MSNLYHAPQPGDVLMLFSPLSECAAGPWVLLSIESDGLYARLSRAGEDEDGGLCTTCRVVNIPIADLCLFVPTDLQIELLD